MKINELKTAGRCFSDGLLHRCKDSADYTENYPQPPSVATVKNTRTRHGLPYLPKTMRTARKGRLKRNPK
ncbi:hypothetical protein [Neisseria sp.]|uniref:hypothetical protein n=1 Tax=Neisseria sp. TaxID=192066 RepID=UPI0026DB4B1E|nr:hypothetical protein [Neisseria sp.]MDO4226271.1 hypothetical protein [Neisseria sp.]